MRDFEYAFRYGFGQGAEINPIVLTIIIVAGIAVFIGLFFLFRAITLWYFKINKMYKELQKTNRYLERMLMSSTNPAAPVQQTPAPAPVAPVSVTPVPVATVQPAPVQPAPVAAEVPVSEAPVQRTCANCGAVLQDGAAFCMACGTKN